MALRFFLVCLICSAFCHAAGQSPIYALKGGEVTLKPDTDGDAVGILWKHNGNKVVEFYGKEQYVYGTYDNRVTLDWSTAVLGITDLRFEDSGEYIAEIERPKGLRRSAHKLEVIEMVTKPNISCEMSNSSSTNVSAQLLCSAEPRGPPMKLEWRTHGNLQPGQQLQISLGAEHDDEVYTCNVSNPLSSETATFTAKDCYPDGLSGGEIAGIVVGVLVVLIVIIVLAVVFYKRYRKAVSGSDKNKAQGDEDKTLLRSPDEAASSPTGDGDPCPSSGKASVKISTDEMPQKGHVSSAMKALSEQNKDGSSKKKFKGYYHSPQSFGLTPLGKDHAIDDNGDAVQYRTPRKRLFSSKPDQKVSITPEHPEPKKEAEENEEAHSAPAGEDEEAHSAPAGEDEEAHSAPAGEDEKAHSAPAGEDEEAHSAPAGEDEKAHSAPAGEDEEALSAPAGASPVAQPPSLLAESPPRMTPEDSAGEHKEDTNSGQVTTEENDSLYERETHESDDKPYTITDQKGSKTLLHEQTLTLSQGETNPSDSDDDNNKNDSVGDREEAGQQQHLYSDTSQQTQGPTPADSSTTLQESPHTARSHPDGEEELKPSRDSDEGAGQSVKVKAKLWDATPEKNSQQ